MEKYRRDGEMHQCQIAAGTSKEMPVKLNEKKTEKEDILIDSVKLIF